MPETFEALAILALALLPGALYVWSFERLAGAWGARLTDRILRFVEVSAILHALLAPVTFWLWREFLRTGRLSTGDVPLALWVVPLIYVALPMAAGTAVGLGTRRRSRWAGFFTGPNPAPRAWDYLFGSRPDGWIRLRLKSGIWVGGAYSSEGDRRSYAAGYPEEQDLYLVETVEVEPETGEFLLADDGNPRLRDSGILVRWSEVEYLDFIEA